MYFKTFHFDNNNLVSQAFKAIFTSPSSAEDDVENEIPRNEGPPPTKRARGDITMATRSNNATLCGLKSVTPRSIAYVAVQVNISNNSPHTIS